MGQSSVSILNKVGYSMYWNSMWDNKIMYNKYLKEDIYLNSFFDLIFSDNISNNLFNFKKINTNYKEFYLNQSIGNDLNSLKKYLLNINNISHFSSKIWILKYQKWLIIYNFIYISKTNKQNNKNISFFNYKSNFFYMYKYYLKFNNYLNNDYSFYKKKINFFSF